MSPLKVPYHSYGPKEPCPVCGVIFENHLRCKGCRCLVGRGHSVDRLFEGYCEGCQGHRECNPEAFAAALAGNVDWGL